MLRSKRIIKNVRHFLGLKLGPRERKSGFIFDLDLENAGRLFYLERMIRIIKNIDGDIVECGVGESKSLQMLCLLAQIQGIKKKVIGFDSFSGFPEPTVNDQSPRNPQKGDWNVLNPEDVIDALRQIGISHEFINTQVDLIKGFFEDILPNKEIGSIALLHLDVDLYNSYKVCLENLFPKVVQGGVVLFDEYMNQDDVIMWPGAKKAIDEYFFGKDYKILRDSLFGKYYLIKN